MKTTKEMIEVMQAYERGEKIECFNDEEQWRDVNKPIWDWLHNDYRVKPKPKYVQFDTAEEFLAAQREHGKTVRCKIENFLFNSYVNECGDMILIGNYGYTKIEDICSIFSKYEFADGTPCGKEVK